MTNVDLNYKLVHLIQLLAYTNSCITKTASEINFCTCVTALAYQQV